MLLQGPKYGLTVNGGECEIMDDGSVECTNPSIVLKGTPLTCNLPYRAAAALEVGAAAAAARLLQLPACCTWPIQGCVHACVRGCVCACAHCTKQQYPADSCRYVALWKRAALLVLRPALTLRILVLSAAVQWRWHTRAVQHTFKLLLTVVDGRMSLSASDDAV